MDATADFDSVDDCIAAAEAALAALAEEYPAHAAADLAAMRSAFDRLWARFEGATGRVACAVEAEAVFAIAHNVKGQGASFGYDLMTEFGERLCEALRGRTDLTLDEVEAAGAYLGALDDVLALRLRGDGGATGRAIRAALPPQHAAHRA